MYLLESLTRNPCTWIAPFTELYVFEARQSSLLVLHSVSANMAADPLTSRTVDNLLAEDIDFDFDDDPFAEPKPPQNTTRDDKSTLSPRKRKAAQDDAFGGNVDEEIKIVKQRAKIPKLDVDRLCSKPGIPQIRELVRSGKLKKKLRLKGKGHELSDAARLLNYYQIWLDKLYPRAKFADALQLVEKAGHSKRMQVMRKAWIDEGKHGYSRKEVADSALGAQKELEMAAATSHQDNIEPSVQVDDDGTSMMFVGEDTTDEQDRDMTGPDDDELDLLLAQEQEMSTAQPAKTAQIDSEGEDDLDALLAQQGTRKRRMPSVVDEDQDDLDELLYEQELENQKANGRKEVKQISPNATVIQGDEDVNQDELDILLNTEIQTNTSAATTAVDGKITEEFDDDFDDLDDLDTILAQQEDSNGKTEPDLPPITTTAAIKLVPTNAAEDVAPDSEEVPELDNVISSSPIPNVRTDELDELMDEHDAKINQRTTHTPQKTKDDSQLVEEFMSSSPVPNEI